MLLYTSFQTLIAKLRYLSHLLFHFLYPVLYPLCICDNQVCSERTNYFLNYLHSYIVFNHLLNNSL